MSASFSSVEFSNVVLEFSSDAVLAAGGFAIDVYCEEGEEEVEAVEEEDVEDEQPCCEYYA